MRCRGPYSCYVKGCLQPTYSLGDAYLKYAYFNHFPGRVVAPPYKPPYIKTVPQITARPLHNIQEGDVLILGTDGVWDYLSDQNAVDRIIGTGEFYTFDGNAIFNTLDTLKPGNGYWVKMNQASSLTVNNAGANDVQNGDRTLTKADGLSKLAEMKQMLVTYPSVPAICVAEIRANATEEAKGQDRDGNEPRS